MTKKFIIIAGISGALAVGLGAFGAHSLKSVLSEYQLSIFKTGVQYQFWHTLAILALAVGRLTDEKYFKISAWLFTVGIVFFSGSLYLLACRDILNLNSLTPILGPMTPMGGVMFFMGWICIVLSQIFKKEN